MRGVIDEISGSYLRCLMQNGDVLRLHKSLLPAETKEGDVIQLAVTLDQEGTRRQRELMDGYKN